MLESLKEGASEAAKGIGDHLLERIKDAPGEIGQEAMHQVGRGAQELASGLFNGNAFVQYGHRADHDQDKAKDGAEMPQKEEERGGMEM
jgi:hypothetical protein